MEATTSMINTLKIIKESEGVWFHIPNGIEANKFAISDFEISLDGNVFKIVEIDGAKRYNYLVQNITVQDNSNGGTIESFFSPTALYRRLKTLNYTPFINEGTSYIVVTGSSYINNFEYVGGDQDIQIADNVKVLNVFLNEGRLLKLGIDYTVNQNTLTVLYPLEFADTIYITGLIDQRAKYINNHIYTGGAQEITIPIGTIILNLFLNDGRLLRETIDYTLNDTIITIIYALEINDTIYIIGLN